MIEAIENEICIGRNTMFMNGFGPVMFMNGFGPPLPPSSKVANFLSLSQNMRNAQKRMKKLFYIFVFNEIFLVSFWDLRVFLQT